MLSTRIAKDVDRSVISFPATITPFSDQLLAEDDETVNKKFAGLFFFAACALGSGHQWCWMILLTLLPLVAARRPGQQLRPNNEKTPLTRLKRKIGWNSPKRTGDFKGYASIESKTPSTPSLCVELNRLNPEPKRYTREWHHTSHPERGRRRLATESLPAQLGLAQRLPGPAAARR